MKKLLSLIISVVISICLLNTVVLADTDESALFLDVHFVGNWIFDTYDVTVYLDDTAVDTIAHGKNYSKLIENVSKGTHRLSFRSVKAESVRGDTDFEVDGDTTFQCTLQAYSDYVKITDINLIDNVDLSALPVPDLSGLILSEAINQLTDTGFANIKSQTKNDSIWEEDNWIVTDQNLKPGTTAEKNTVFDLYCIKTKDYLEEKLVDLSSVNAKETAKDLNFEVSYKNAATRENINDRIEGMSDQEKEEWIVSEVTPAAEGERKAELTLVCTSNRDVPNVAEQSLTEALQTMAKSDFSNVNYKSNSGSSIWDTDNWKVISQSPEAGATVSADSEVKLEVQSYKELNETAQAADESEPTADTEPIEKTEPIEEAESVAAAKPAATTEDAVISLENDEFAAILVQWDWASDAIKDFAANNKGQTITFPGYVVEMLSDDDVHYNIGVSFGDKTENHDSSGPWFYFKNVTIADMAGETEGSVTDIHEGDRLFFTAKVDEYDDSLDLFYLTPVSAVTRTAPDYSSKETVQKVQEALNANGFNCGTPDGIAGGKTKEAISNYRENNSLVPGDFIDYALLVSLDISPELQTEETSSNEISAIADSNEASQIEEASENVQSNASEPATASQENAIREAKSYLNYTSFSRNGLIDQLSSEYGSGYPYDDAVFAVTYLEENGLVDWYEQARKEAEDYLEYTSFSRKGLIEQLTSEYGSGFTADQAEQAVAYLEQENKVDWYEQAVLEAESYLEYMSFSRNELIDQLTSDYGSGFTYDQAVYAVDQVYK